MSDTSNFDTPEKVDILFKTAMGFPSTDENTAWFQETNIPYSSYVFGSDILTDDIPANPTYGAAKTYASVGLTDSDFDTDGFVKDSTDGKVRYYHRLILDQCISGNNDSWYKLNSSGVNVLTDSLQFNTKKDGSSLPYLYSLTNKANVSSNSSNPTPLTPGSGSGNWIFDVKSGVLFFPDNSTPSLGVVDNSTKKPVFSFYKYIGNKGLSTWSGGGGGGGGGGSGQSSDGVLDGQVLETLTGICDGSTVKVSSGSYTLENVTLKQTMQDTYLAVSGSSVNYKPPSGTNKIIYNFYTIVRPKQTSGTVRLAFEYRLYVDGTEISSYNAGIYENYKGGGAPSSEFNPSFVLTIGEKNDVVNGHFLSWDSNKVVEIRARSYDGSNETDDGVTFHEYWWRAVSSGSAGTSGPATFVKPRLEIQAIGRGKSGVALAGTNMSYVNFPDFVSFTLNHSYTEIEGLRLNITPEYADSIIEVKYLVYIECTSYTRDMGAIITRTVNGVETDIKNITGGTDRWDLLGKPTGDDQYNSGSPWLLTIDYYDTPNTTSAVTYKIKLVSANANTTRTVYINRPTGNEGANSYLVCMSTSSAIEHPKPNKALNPITSATQVDGQVLETFAGVCDGRTVVGISGSYTLENVTLTQTLTYTYTKVTGSEISYKPPAGTKQVVYEFYFIASTDDNDDFAFQLYFYIDGVEATKLRKRSGSWYHGLELETYQVILSIGDVSTDDIPSGKLASWNTTRTLLVKARDRDGNLETRVHCPNQWFYQENTASVNGDTQNVVINTDAKKALYFMPPQLKMTAIGTADYDVVQRVVTYKDGQVLEKLEGLCDGRSITTSSGTYTLPTAVHQTWSDSEHTMKDLDASIINYKPPPGTKQVIYEFRFVWYYNGNGGFSTGGYDFYLDGNKLGNTDVWSTGAYESKYHTLKLIVQIGETNDYTNNKISDWNSLKQIKIQMNERYDSNRGFVLHKNNYIGSPYFPGTTDTTVYYPTIKITAIGRQVAPASAADFKIQKVDTISTLPNNGNMLTWDQAKGRWKPSEFIVENNDGTKNISDINMYQGYQITASNHRTSSNGQYRPDAAFYDGGNQGDYSKWIACNDSPRLYNTSHVYTGTTSTNGYTGEWIQINFGKKAKVYSMNIRGTFQTNGANNSPKDYKVFGSNDGTTWVDVHTGSAVYSDYVDLTGNEASYQKTKIDTFSTPATYQYFRLVIHSFVGPTPSNHTYCPAIQYMAYYGNFPNERIQTLPVSGTNMVTTTYTTATSITAPNSVPGVNIPELNLTITPQYSSSVIELKFNVFHETNSDNVFRITRNINGADVLVVPATNVWEGGIDVPKYDANTTSTPEVTKVRWYDEPNTTSPVTYKLWINSSSSGGAQTVYLNRAYSNAGASLYENGVSTSAAIEHPKPQAILSSVNNSTAVEGQVLETLAGMCDGRSITISSGTYTLENVTAYLETTTTWTKLTGSEINYKPPVGTKQVIYSVSAFQGYANDSYCHQFARCMIDDQEIIMQHLGGWGVSTHTYGNIINFKFVIDMGTTDDIANGKILNWDTLKNLKVEVRDYNTDSRYSQRYHGNTYQVPPDSNASGSNVTDYGYSLTKPKLEIVAIGTADYDVVQRVVTYKDGQVLETLAGVCDGRSITSASGTYTLPNISSVLDMTGSATYQDIPGSFAYKPPQGTTQVIYKYKVYCAGKDNHPILHFNLYIDDTKVDKFDRSWAAQGGGEHVAMLDFTFEIGKVNDIANGKLLTWDTLKTIKIKAREYTDSTHEVYIFGTGYYNGTWVNPQTFVCPSLEITAIGRQGTAAGGVITETGGRVGIGTTSPLTKLDIRRSGGARLRLENSAGNYPDQNQAVEFCTTYATTGFIHQKGENLRIGATGGSSKIYFYTNNNTGYPTSNDNTQTQSFFNETYTSGNDNPRMVIDVNGNVGIGTTTPASHAKLHINGDSASTYLYVSGGGSGNSYKRIQLGATADANRIYSSRADGTHATIPLWFNVSNGNAPDMAIKEDGNVGIGTTTPGYKLEVDGSVKIGSHLILSSSTVGGDVIREYPYVIEANTPTYATSFSSGNGIKQGIFKSYGVYGDSGSNTSGWDCTVYSFRSGGAVSYGSLCFNRINKYGNRIDDCDNIYFYGATVYAGGTSVSSDDRIKHNEKLISNALDTINKIEPKHYFKTSKMYDANHDFDLDNSGNPLNDSGNRLNIDEEYEIETGIIAQELQKIPELAFSVRGEEYIERTVVVYKQDDNGNDLLDSSGNKIIENESIEKKPSKLSVDYNSIFTTHIAATQELHKAQQADSAETAELKTKNTELENKVNELENKVNTVYNKNALLEAEIMMIKNKIGL